MLSCREGHFGEVLRVWVVMWLLPVFPASAEPAPWYCNRHWLRTLKFQKAGETDFPLLNFPLLFNLYGASLTFFFLKSVHDQGSGLSWIKGLSGGVGRGKAGCQ